MCIPSGFGCSAEKAQYFGQDIGDKNRERGGGCRGLIKGIEHAVDGLESELRVLWRSDRILYGSPRPAVVEPAVFEKM